MIYSLGLDREKKPQQHAPLEERLFELCKPLARLVGLFGDGSITGFTSIKVWVGPSGDEWWRQKGRSLTYYLDWFGHPLLSFPEDPDRLYWMRGWDPFPEEAEA